MKLPLTELSSDRFDVQLFADAFDEEIHVKRFLQEVVGAGSLQLGDFVLFDHPADANDFHIIHRGIAANALANFFAVDVRQHHIQHDDVGTVLFHHHASVEAVVGDADIEPAVGVENVAEHFHQFLVIIDEQSFPFAALEGIGGDAVVLHKPEEDLAGNAAEPGTGNAKPFELARIEAANDSLLADIANFRRFASREDSLHKRDPSFESSTRLLQVERHEPPGESCRRRDFLLVNGLPPNPCANRFASLFFTGNRKTGQVEFTKVLRRADCIYSVKSVNSHCLN